MVKNAMKNRFIMLIAITFALLPPLIYLLIKSSQPTLEDIETSSENGVHVTVDKSASADEDISENHLLHDAGYANVKKWHVSQNTSHTAVNMALGKANEIGNEEADLDSGKVDGDNSLAVTSSGFTNPADAEYHYINLFIESEILNDYLLNSVVCMENACTLSFLTANYEQQSELKTNLINILIQENRKFNVELDEVDDEYELVLSITNG